jgi:hypothetical protein
MEVTRNENRWGSDHSLKLGVDGKIILEWILKEKQDGQVWTGGIWFRIGISGGLL